jgi:DNA polymerase bacteriophage-type
VTELFLDYESKGRLDLEDYGLDNYSRCATPLMLGWALNERKVQVWFPPTPMPSELEQALHDPTVTKISWNAQFERVISRRCLGLSIPIPQWRDPMVLARSLSMPGKLKTVCEVMKIGKDEAKIKDGERLIKLFCEPNGEEGMPTLYGKSDGFNDPRDYPLDFRMFIDYCIRDVEVERNLWYKMQKLSFPEKQWEDWFLSEEMNEYGLPINVERARKALGLAERFKRESQATLNALTGLENANSRDQLLPWLEERGYAWGSLLKNYVDFELKNPNSNLTPEARAVLELRQKSSQNSYKKLEAMLRQVGPDGRLRYQFSYFGAARTGRWSSMGVQVQNLPRPIKKVEKDMQRALNLIDSEDYNTILKEYDGSTLPFIASCLRMFIEVT